MSPPRCPVPRPSSSSLERYFTCARIFFLSTMVRGASAADVFPFIRADVFACPAARSSFANTQTNTSKPLEKNTAHFFMATPRAKELFLDAILQQIFQLAHKFLHVLEVHIH